MSMYNCYYVLYKLINSPYMWIVRASDNYYELIEFFDNCHSDKEEYYLIKKKVDNLEDIVNFKKFTIYEKNNKYIILYRSK